MWGLFSGYQANVLFCNLVNLSADMPGVFSVNRQLGTVF
jgi:hypothetical protein